MSVRPFLRVPVGLATVSLLSVLALSSGFLVSQATVSAAPPRLFEVKTIYIAPSSDDLVRLLKSRLEQWGTVKVTPQVEEADAILSCETESRIVPAKVVIKVIDAHVRLVDRHSQKLIWSTKKSTSWDNRLVDDIIDQLKRDREKSFSNY
ncbi:MAG: hypothetical protein LAP86_00015 [Acidobacteriia bacterium]|nr:hypothetical protein [Terriglobia bacterium]